jgi:hypothetical protein
MRITCSLLTTLLCFCLFSAVHAAGFSAMVSPPRFELQGRPGEVIRQIVTIENGADIAASFAIRTADWDLADDGGVTIHPPELQPGSCRPWARLERRTIRLQPHFDKRFRFEIHVPAEAPEGECRLAILVEPADDRDVLATARNIRFPVQGRIAVIVYVNVGGAKPLLNVQSLALQEGVDGQPVPVVVLENTGNAHGRPDGFLEARDSTGRRVELAVAQTPILPGQTRAIRIVQTPAEGESAVKLTPPLDIKGIIEWDGGQQKIEATLK